MPNFDDIPLLHEVEGIGRRVYIGERTRDFEFGDKWRIVRTKNLPFAKYEIADKWRVIHVVLNWMGLGISVHYHEDHYYFLEQPNGARTHFTVDHDIFATKKIPGTIELYINGLRNFINQDYIETTNGIQLIGDTIAKAGDFLWCHYRKFTDD